jgi:Na+-translocating ferredoxin:NAD+ oxidoreductase subunit G
MKDMLKMALVLGVICILSGGLLAVVNHVTKDPIAAALREEKMKAMREVLPEYDNDPMTCTNAVVENGKTWVFHVARKNGNFAGAAFEASSGQGYSGTIRIMVGVRADDTIQGIEILQQTETPGLGARIAESSFRDQFNDKNILTTRWQVRKDGGDIDAITGATISPRAVLDALRDGLKVYTSHKANIFATAAK